jgi:hypothetical protein
MNLKDFEKRLAAVERELALLKQALTAKEGNGAWLKMFGKYADDPGYRAMAEAGKRWRETENRRKP